MSSALAVTLAICSHTFAVHDQVRPGDLLVSIDDPDAIVAIDPETGLIRRTISGDDVSRPPGDPEGLIGGGPDEGAYSTLHMLNARDLYVNTRFAPVVADVFTGDREPTTEAQGLIIEGLPNLFRGFTVQDSALLDERRVLLFMRLTPTSVGRLVMYDLVEDRAEVVSGPERGDGPVFLGGGAIAVTAGGDYLVATSGVQGMETTLFRVDAASGDRTPVSRLTNALQDPIPFPIFENGVEIGGFTWGPGEGGSGPVTNTGPFSMITLDGKVYIGSEVMLPNTEGDFDYMASIMRIDPSTGDRTLALGTAFPDFVGLSLPELIMNPAANMPEFDAEAPDGLVEDASGRLVFVSSLGPRSVYAWDRDTDELELIANLDAQIHPEWLSMGFGPCLLNVIVYRGTACAADLDGDGDVDLGDFGAFAVAFDAQAGEERFDARADFDRDGDVDLGDFGAFGASFGRTDCLD